MTQASDEFKRRKAELLELGKQPFRQRNPAVLAWLRREVPEWNQRDPEGDATYSAGQFAVDGSFVDNGRKRIYHNAPIGLNLPPSGQAQLDPPKPGSTREMARIQQFKGKFTLIICGIPVPLEWAQETDMVQNPLTLVMEERPIIRPLVLENGIRTVSPTMQPDLFAFLELHPDRWDSPARNRDLFSARLGSPVLSPDINIDSTPARFRRGMSVDVQVTAMITDAEDMEQLSMVARLDDTTLGRIGFETGFREIVNPQVNRRQQLIAHAGNILKDKTPQNQLRRNIVLVQLAPDRLETDKTTKAAAQVGALVASIVDGLGAYLLDGKVIEGYTYNSEDVGREIDALITQMRFRQDYPLIQEIATAGRIAAMSQKGQEATYAKHDALIARLHGESLVVTCDRSQAGSNYCSWIVSDNSEPDNSKWKMVCKYKSVNMKRPEKIAALIEWGRSKGSYENLLSIVNEMLGREME